RHRHRGGESDHHLRGFRAGQQLLFPAPGRDRPGPDDLPAPRPPPRRPHHPGQPARRGLHLHPVPALRAEESMNDSKATEAPLVLVVDDVDHGREIFAEYLEFRGFRVATAADGLEALEKAFELLPDVILMDLSLPGIDGWEATRRLKQDERTRDIPVIALTAHALASAHDKAREVGCNAVVTKPCLPQELEQEVRRQLETATKNESKAQP